MKAVQYFRTAQEGEAYTHLVYEQGKYPALTGVVEVSGTEKIAEERPPGIVEGGWLTTGEVAGRLQVTTRTIQNYRDAGQLAFAQVGRVIRYRVKDVEKFMDEHYIRR